MTSVFTGNAPIHQVPIQQSSDSQPTVSGWQSSQRQATPRLIGGGATPPGGRQANIFNMLPKLQTLLPALACVAVGAVGGLALGLAVMGGGWLALGGAALGFAFYAGYYMLRDASRR